MSIFEPVTLEWNGKEYTVPPDKVMGLIARIEETVTLSEVHKYATRGGTPLAKIATAYADAINYAGGKVAAEEVYSSFFSAGSETIPAAVSGLLMMMVPPQKTGQTKPGKPVAARSSSRKRT